jgi:hypothetical protein
VSSPSAAGLTPYCNCDQSAVHSFRSASDAALSSASARPDRPHLRGTTIIGNANTTYSAVEIDDEADDER